MTESARTAVALSGAIEDDPASARLSLVIIDDEPACCVAYEVALREWFPSASLRFIHDGAWAWFFLTQHNPDLLVMDLNRSGIDGIELLRRLSMARTAYPILVISSCLPQLEGEARAAAGCLDVALVSKPVSLDVLRSQVFGLLRIPMNESPS